MLARVASGITSSSEGALPNGLLRRGGVSLLLAGVTVLTLQRLDHQTTANCLGRDSYPLRATVDDCGQLLKVRLECSLRDAGWLETEATFRDRLTTPRALLSASCLLTGKITFAGHKVILLGAGLDSSKPSGQNQPPHQVAASQAG